MNLSSLFHRVTKSKTITIYLISILFFPGTVLHELSHYFMAGILFVRVGEIEFMPKLQGDSVKLGSVAVAETDIFRRFLIGAAPFLFGISLLLGLLFYAASNGLFENQWFIIGMLYMSFQIGNTMFSSKKDMEGALELLGVMLFFVIVFYFLGVRLPALNVELLFGNPMVLQVFKQGSLFLLVPLGINVLIILLLKLSPMRKI